MTKTTLQKFTLLTMSLLATLALSAQGAPKAHVSSSSGAKQNSVSQRHVLPNSLDADYQYDDGTSEQGVGFGNGGQNFQSVWLNQFAVIAGKTAITSVEVVWGSPVFPGFAPNGTPVTIGVWSDPNGDGSPTDSTLLGSVAGTVQNSDTDTFVTYTFGSAVNLPGGATSFFVGDLTPMNDGSQGELFWQGQDTSDHAPNKSWIVANGSGADVDINNLGNNDTIGTIDSFGLPGNWLIRANGTTSGPFSFDHAVSRETDGGAGKFDVLLPGVEDRKAAPTIVFIFTDAVASVDSVATSCGTVTQTRASGAGFSVMLDNHGCDAQNVTVTLTGIHSTGGETVASAAATVGLLAGDVDGDGTVTKADSDSIKAHLREPVTSSNFRFDVQNNGQINQLDARTVRANLGHSL